MIDEVYRIGVRRRIKDLTKEAGAQHIGSILGSSLLGGLFGSLAGPAIIPMTPLAYEPIRFLGLPPTRGELEHSREINRVLGALTGALAGAGLGSLAVGGSELLNKLRGEKIKNLLKG